MSMTHVRIAVKNTEYDTVGHEVSFSCICQSLKMSIMSVSTENVFLILNVSFLISHTAIT